MLKTSQTWAGSKAEPTQQTVLVFEGSDSRRRIEERDAGGAVTKAFSQSKQKLKQHGCLNLYLPRCAYDVRIGVAFEGPDQAAGEREGWEMKRERKRTTVKNERKLKEWQLDLTKVW